MPVELRSSSALSNRLSSHRFLITGGGGYVGRSLAQVLAARGDSVSLADLQFSSDDSKFKRVQVDVAKLEDVDQAVSAGYDCVFHVASFGMSGGEMLKKDKIYAVNVVGTRNVIAACQKHGVKALVYTSTYNVVFGGQEIRNGDETLPYLPMDRHVDAYSRTKSEAEQLVLSANSNSGLLTCALRLAGVYGPGEQRHLPRAVGFMAVGAFRVRWGLRQADVDFLHIDNLVQGHVKAADRLLLGDRRVAGRAFFLSDGAPTPNFDFFAKLAGGLGYPTPCLAAPYHAVYGLAWLAELAHSVANRLGLEFEPWLTRAEVCKTGVTHYFSVAAAADALGYQPTVSNDLTECVTWFRLRGWGRPTAARPARGSARCLRLLLSLACALCLCALLASMLPGVA
uniref:3Beta_HSD domain-containing protein n=1 Tax=Macrostomum lignano TaxID=282301 RepID=A0A1I8IRF9_9PLAT